MWTISNVTSLRYYGQRATIITKSPVAMVDVLIFEHNKIVYTRHAYPVPVIFILRPKREYVLDPFHIWRASLHCLCIHSIHTDVGVDKHAITFSGNKRVGMTEIRKRRGEANATVGSDGVVVSVVIPATLATALRRFSIDVLVKSFFLF